MTMQVNHLLETWLYRMGEESKAVRDKLEEKIDSYAAGKLDHAVDAILCIWEKSGYREEELATPLPVSRLAGRISSSVMKFMGYDIRPALVKSMKEGHLVDRKYWAKRSRDGSIKPIYCSSDVTCAGLFDFDACKSTLYGDYCGTKPCSTAGAPTGIRRATR